MATLTLNNWAITPLNPDGTDNTSLPNYSGTTPPTDTVDFAFMGQRFKLELEYELAGSYPDTSTADVNGLFVRYTPAMFVEQFTSFLAGTIPSSGYTLVIPSTSLATYPMAMVVNNPSTANSSENGMVELEVLGNKVFKITHYFRIISDTENYFTGLATSNQLRLTKGSVFDANEGEALRPSVFNTTRALNAVVCTRKDTFSLFTTEFSIPFRASFKGTSPVGSFDFPSTVTIEKVSNNEAVNFLSPYEDCKVTISFTDPLELIQTDEVVVLVAKRLFNQNRVSYEVDLDVSEAKLETTVSTTVIDGVIKGPVSYTQADGITSVSFVVDKTGIEYNKGYDIHFAPLFSRDVSEFGYSHGVLRVGSLSDSLPVDFDMDCEFWTRYGVHANNMVAAVMQRLVNVCTIDYSDYNNLASPPFTNFDADFAQISFELKNAVSGAVLYSGGVGKNTATNEILSNAQVETIKDEENGLYRFVAREFRIPYENFQNLPNLGGNPLQNLNNYVFTWKIRFVASADELQVIEYTFDCDLQIRPYENQNGEPSYVPKVSNIRFLNPETGLPISAWCDLEEILVLADVEDLGETTYVLAYVDDFPLGAIYQNDYALKEEDPQSHTLPSYVTFEEKQTDLISDFNADTSSGTVSFRLDISNLSGEEKQRISVKAYKSED
jgi:hypothetical protein